MVLSEALATRREQHDKNNTAQVAAGLARLALAQDRLPEATSLIAESISLRQELGEINALAESNLIHAEILLEQEKAAAAEKSARDAAATFHRSGAWGREGDAGITIARAQLARGAAAAANQTLAAADKYLSDSRDARLRLWRDRTQAGILHALDRHEEAAAILGRGLSESRRLGFLGMTLEMQFAGLRAGISPAPQLATDAQQAGFLLIARKVRE
jgi:hypothetical protein